MSRRNSSLFSTQTASNPLKNAWFQKFSASTVHRDRVFNTHLFEEYKESMHNVCYYNKGERYFCTWVPEGPR